MGRVTELLGIEYPIIAGAMGGVSGPELVAAVSNAGGIGVLATAGQDPEKVRESVRKTKELTDKPFGANIAIIAGQAEEIIKVLFEEGVKFFTTGAGDPIPFIEPIHEAGGIIFPVVPSGRVARKVEKAGADGVIVEGTEAGGHVGEATTMTLTRQAVAVVENIPVVAAGGIADGRGMAAAYTLGAEGVQIGTVLVAAEETPIHENYKQAVVDANDTATTVVGREVGAPIRVEKNQGAQGHVEFIQNESDGDVGKVTKNELNLLLKGVNEGEREDALLTYGQIAGLVNEIRPVKDIIEGIYNEAKEVLKSTEIS